MKTMILYFLLVTAIGGAVANNMTSAKGLPSTNVFRPGLAKGYSDFRIPAIVRTDKGTLLAFAEARTTGADASVHQIAVRRSTDNGKSWGPLAFAAGSDAHWVGNPTAVFTADNKAMLVYVKHNKTCAGDCGTGNGMVTSSDDGLTWSADTDLSAMFGPASGSLPGPGAALQLRADGGPHAGRILVPSHHGPYERDYVSVSDDGGTTWRTIATTFPKMDEAQMTQLANGSIVLNMRHACAPEHVRGVSFSHDGGDTFSAISFDTALISPVCQASIATIAGKTYFSNPASKTARDNITIRRSSDNAATWPDALLVQPAATSGYTCLVDTPIAPGTGGILFEDVQNTISFAAFPLDF